MTITHDEFQAQPVRRIARDGAKVLLLGTAHVSRASVDAVHALLDAEPFDAIGVELCAPRADAIRNPGAIRDLDLFRVLKEGRAGVVAAGLALGAYQRRLAKQFGIEPGAEMKAAMDLAHARGLPCWLVDRDVGVTLRRSRAAVGWWERAKLSAGLVAGLLDDSEVDEAQIERLKAGDVLEGAFTEFASGSPPLFEALIAERDRYMAARVREELSRSGAKRALVVVGAGHLDGMARALDGEQAEPAAVLPALRAEPPPSSFGKWFGIALLLFVLGGFAWAFSRGFEVGLDAVLTWVLVTGALGAIGAAAAGAHPLSIVAAFLASPITPLHPALASGMVSAGVELWARKPRVGDFEALRDDLDSLRGWWRNRVSRVLLVFFLTSLGTAIGVWVAGFSVARQLRALA
jgi:pheromone shutdown-related protein TraB